MRQCRRRTRLRPARPPSSAVASSLCAKRADRNMPQGGSAYSRMPQRSRPAMARAAHDRGPVPGACGTGRRAVPDGSAVRRFPRSPVRSSVSGRSVAAPAPGYRPSTVSSALNSSRPIRLHHGEAADPMLCDRPADRRPPWQTRLPRCRVLPVLKERMPRRRPRRLRRQPAPRGGRSPPRFPGSRRCSTGSAPAPARRPRWRRNAARSGCASGAGSSASRSTRSRRSRPRRSGRSRRRPRRRRQRVLPAADRSNTLRRSSRHNDCCRSSNGTGRQARNA